MRSWELKGELMVPKIYFVNSFVYYYLGMIYGEFKVCTYDASYYCFECHENEEHVIPARVIHNWDLRKHQVAKKCKMFLMQIEEEPLFNIDETNPTLYNVIKELLEVKVGLENGSDKILNYFSTCQDTFN